MLNLLEKVLKLSLHVTALHNLKPYCKQIKFRNHQRTNVHFSQSFFFFTASILQPPPSSSHAPTLYMVVLLYSGLLFSGTGLLPAEWGSGSWDQNYSDLCSLTRTITLLNHSLNKRLLLSHRGSPAQDYETCGMAPLVAWLTGPLCPMWLVLMRRGRVLGTHWRLALPDTALPRPAQPHQPPGARLAEAGHHIAPGSGWHTGCSGLPPCLPGAASYN